MDSSFTTKELLSRCSANSKVMHCSTQHSFLGSLQMNYFSEQFHMAASLCISHISTKRKAAANQTIACSRSAIQKLDMLWNVHKVYNKDTGTNSIDVALVSLLLTLNRFHILFLCFYCYFEQVNIWWVEGLIILITILKKFVTCFQNAWSPKHMQLQRISAGRNTLRH